MYYNLELERAIKIASRAILRIKPGRAIAQFVIIG